MYLLVGIVGLAIPLLVGYGFYLGRQMNRVDAALANAAVEIELEATLAGLMFEIMIDEGIATNPDLIWSDLEDKIVGLRARVDVNRQAPLKNIFRDYNAVVDDIDQLAVQLTQLQQNAQQRLKTGADILTETYPEQAYQLTYTDFMFGVNRLQAAFGAIAQQNFRRFQYAQVMLIVICLVLSALIAFAFNRFERQRANYLDVLQQARNTLQNEVTRRKAAQVALSTQMKALQLANQELAEIAYVAAHDLRAPMRAINNYADFLREDLGSRLNQDQQRYLDAMQSAASEADVFVRDLLKMSDIDQQRRPTQCVRTGEFLQAQIADMAFGEEVQIDLAPEWPDLEADPFLLQAIFQNLIENAVRFNASAIKQIGIAWRQTAPEEIEICVSDNGIGIDPRYHSQIFGIFEKLHTRREYEGTGIGLAIVKKAVLKLNGSIRLESREGEGTRVLLTLPQKQPAENAC